MRLKPNRKFRLNKTFKKDYNRLFRENPEAANVFLLLSELADRKGRVLTDEGQLAVLMAARFSDPREYAL